MASDAMRGTSFGMRSFSTTLDMPYAPSFHSGGGVITVTSGARPPGPSVFASLMSER